jgi:hypothetical protein
MIDDDDTQVYRSELEAAVKAAVLAEREACAKLCDEYARSGSDHEASAALNIQDAIRARGETK